MTAAPDLVCPHCKQTLGPGAILDNGSSKCDHCQRSFEFFPFPAFRASPPLAARATVTLGEETVCFFHAENRAESICEDCGRLLCSICAVRFNGKKLCPSCVSSLRSSDAVPVVKARILYDKLALSVAVLPVLFWPVTLLTAPSVLGLVIYGWKKPGSIVGGARRTRLVLAALIATAEITAWIILFTHLTNLKRHR